MEDRERYRTGERAIAPLFAVVVPTLIVVALMVVTAISARPRKEIRFEIAQLDPEPQVVPDDPPDRPEPQDPVVTADERLPEVEVDLPDVPGVAELTAPGPAAYGAEQTVAKPAQAEAVQFVKSVVTLKGLAVSRTPGGRARYTSGKDGNYGDPATESAVMKALRWLKKTQRTDGSWAGNPISNTALAVLAFLAHGEAPGASAEFGKTVERALEHLVAAQDGDGDDVRFRGADGNEYAFLIATYALSEAYGMTGNPNVKAAALKGLGRIVRNQSPTGGWDYRLNRESTRDDMSFAGWALQALKAGKMAGLHPEGLEACVKKAVRCLETRNFRDGGFGYTAGGAPTGLTATGCLAMQLLGYGERPAVASALDYMRAWHPAFEKGKMAERAPGACPQYYCYYAAQCKYQAGMRPGATAADQKAWQEWNREMKALYPRTIVTPDERIPDAEGRPCEIGYWTNADAHGSGETMATCLAALQLMVYYRYLPTTQATPPAARPERPRRTVRRDVCVDVDL